MQAEQGERYYVAPLAGAWIEIYKIFVCIFYSYVAPLAGAWIEIKQLF